jgi:hypothetical protein
MEAYLLRTLGIIDGGLLPHDLFRLRNLARLATGRLPITPAIRRHYQSWALIALAWATSRMMPGLSRFGPKPRKATRGESPVLSSQIL